VSLRLFQAPISAEPWSRNDLQHNNPERICLRERKLIKFVGKSAYSVKRLCGRFSNASEGRNESSPLSGKRYPLRKPDASFPAEWI
jgi:hypothetical protein